MPLAWVARVPHSGTIRSGHCRAWVGFSHATWGCARRYSHGCSYLTTPSRHAAAPFSWVLLAVCGVTSVMAATSEIVWLAIHGGDLNYGNVMFNLWMTSFMVAGAIWSSRMFVQVDAGRWGGEEAAAAASRAQRVVTMNPVAGAWTTEPMGHMEHLVSTAQKGKGDM